MKPASIESLTTIILKVLCAAAMFVPMLVHSEWQPAKGPLLTRWAADVSPKNAHPEYPRPQMVRKDWQNLNGLWDYAIAMLARRKLVVMGLFILIGIFFIPMMLFSAEKKVVRIWHTETEPQSVKGFQQIIDDFEKLNPDITVKQEALAWGDLEAKLTAALAAGAPPDASHGQAVTCAHPFMRKAFCGTRRISLPPSAGTTSGKLFGCNAFTTGSTTEFLIQQPHLF